MFQAWKEYRCVYFSLSLSPGPNTAVFVNRWHYLFLLTEDVSRSQWPCGLRRTSAVARLLRSWVRIQPGAWMLVCCECCLLSGRRLCDELITRPEESYRLWWVVVCDLETTRMRRSWPALGRSATIKKKMLICHFCVQREMPCNIIGVTDCDMDCPRNKLLYLYGVFLFWSSGLKIFVKLTTGVCRSKKRMDGKTVIVTGANTGIV
jgi:hypothetical protein